MRPWRRRRPAGPPRVPIRSVLLVPAAPALLRIAADHSLLDAPWRLQLASIAHVWPEPRTPGGWARVGWPWDLMTGRFIAPTDLQIGHIIEVADVAGAQCIGWVADADERRFVLVPARDGPEAVSAASRALEVWRAAEIASISDEWRSRLAIVRQRGAVP